MRLGRAESECRMSKCDGMKELKCLVRTREILDAYEKDL